MKIEPGAVCIVVGETEHFERNIGALVTVDRAYVCRHGTRGWLFKEASRPLLVAIYDSWFTGKQHLEFATSSVGAIQHGDRDCLPQYPSHWLLPVKGDGTGMELLSEEKPPAVADAWPAHVNCRCVHP